MEVSRLEPRNKKQISLVGGIPTPLKISKSVGSTIPNIWKNKIHVPNHQPENIEKTWKTQSIWIYLETILTYIDYIILEVNSTLQPPKSTRHASDTTLWTLYTLHSQNSEFHNDLSNSQANSWMIFWSLWEHHLITLYIYIYILVGGFNHLEKYESQWEGLSHILWKNHQPVY